MEAKGSTVREIDGVHVFATVENGRTVSLIDSAGGRATLSIVADGVVRSVFGPAPADEGTK